MYNILLLHVKDEMNSAVFISKPAKFGSNILYMYMYMYNRQSIQASSAHLYMYNRQSFKAVDPFLKQFPAYVYIHIHE